MSTIFNAGIVLSQNYVHGSRLVVFCFCFVKFEQIHPGYFTGTRAFTRCEPRWMWKNDRLGQLKTENIITKHKVRPQSVHLYELYFIFSLFAYVYIFLQRNEVTKLDIKIWVACQVSKLSYEYDWRGFKMLHDLRTRCIWLTKLDFWVRL